MARAGRFMGRRLGLKRGVGSFSWHCGVAKKRLGVTSRRWALSFGGLELVEGYWGVMAGAGLVGGMGVRGRGEVAGVRGGGRWWAKGVWRWGRKVCRRRGGWDLSFSTSRTG